jgi:hypothetical protein
MAQKNTGRLVIYTATTAAIALGRRRDGLLVNIFERKQEARNPFFRVVEITDDTEDPASGARTSRCSTTATAARWTGAHALRRQRGAAAHAHETPTRARSWRSRASRKTRD